MPVTNANQNGGHTWWIWRIMLRDFADAVAFRTTTTSVVADMKTKRLTATASPATSLPATPTGTVQFFADGKPLGKPIELGNGTATLHGFPTREGSLPWWRVDVSTVSAVYSGDSLYNASNSPDTNVVPAEN